jgi:YjbE family integral membrane protein
VQRNVPSSTGAVPITDDVRMNWAIIDAALLLEIMGVNILLSGDNTIVVGMTIRQLPPLRRQIATAAGIGAALLFQIAATLTVEHLLELRVVSLAAGVALCVIAIRLLHENDGVPQGLLPDQIDRGMFGSILAVAAGYFLMCLDNIIGVATVGHGHPWLLTIGLVLSSAVIVPASLAVARLMRRFPVTLIVGAGIVGWVAGAILAEAAAPLDQLLPGRATRLFIPAATTLMVVTSPIWRRD